MFTAHFGVARELLSCHARLRCDLKMVNLSLRTRAAEAQAASRDKLRGTTEGGGRGRAGASDNDPIMCRCRRRDIVFLRWRDACLTRT